MGGTAAFIGAVAGESVVLYCFFFTQVAYLWFNVIGAAAVVAAALIVEAIKIPRRKDEAPPGADESSPAL